MHLWLISKASLLLGEDPPKKVRCAIMIECGCAMLCTYFSVRLGLGLQNQKGSRRRRGNETTVLFFAQNFPWQSEKTSGLAAGSGTKTGGIPAQCLIARTCLGLCWHNDALLQHTKRKYPLHRHFRSVKSLCCARCFCYALPSHTGHPTLEASESLVCF